MTPINEQIDGLDDKQAIFQLKLLLQAAADGAGFDEAAAAASLHGAAGGSDMLCDGATLIEQNSAVALSPEKAGETARALLHALAASPGGADILAASLKQRDASADFGFNTGPAIGAMIWLALVADVHMELGGFHFHKKGLTPEQQTEVLKDTVPAAVKAVIKSFLAA